MKSFVQTLNTRIGDALGYRDGNPRFAWCWAPEQDWFVFDRDDRTLIKKSWAHAPAPDGSEIGAVWVLGEWRQNKCIDHHGFGQGPRVPSVREFAYSPYFETALAPGQEPTSELTQNYIWALDQQLQKSAEMSEDSFENYMAEEKFSATQNSESDAKAWHEQVAAGYDEHTGAFGNCVPGTAGGFLSFGGV